MEFFQTMMGKRFFEAQVPNIAKALDDIAKELKRANDLKEKEINQQYPSMEAINKAIRDYQKNST